MTKTKTALTTLFAAVLGAGIALSTPAVANDFQIHAFPAVSHNVDTKLVHVANFKFKKLGHDKFVHKQFVNKKFRSNRGFGKSKFLFKPGNDFGKKHHHVNKKFVVKKKLF